MVKLKNILNDLIDYVYNDREKASTYKNFYVEVVNRNMRSKHGDYNSHSRHIRVFNLYRQDDAIIATTIHELAHHVDYINRGITDHQKEFYIVFKMLLYGALDMGLFSKELFLLATRDASDSNKIATMIAGYSPQSVSYKESKRVVEVFNCFNIKDKLKENGYKFNSINKTWEKEVELRDACVEEKILNELSVDYKVKHVTDISFLGNRKIIATKGSFEHKELLKEDGFHYVKEKRWWEKNGEYEDLKEYKEKYPEVIFSLE